MTAAVGHSFPDDADSVSVAPGEERPAWLERDFRLTCMQVASTQGPLQVRSTRAPRSEVTIHAQKRDDASS